MRAQTFVVCLVGITLLIGKSSVTSLIPLLDAQTPGPVVSSVRSGRWSDPAVWSTGAAGWMRRYAHVYAAVVDRAGQTAYTQVIRLRR